MNEPLDITIPEVTVDVKRLEADLRRRITGEVRFDVGSRVLYAADASNYRQVPIGVVIPRSIEDVIATVAIAREHGAPILNRGGGTSIPGQCCNVAVLMDYSKYLHHIIELDAGRRLARVQPGLVLDDLRNAAEQHGLTFGPDPATHKWCTLGGMIGNNSCGVHSVMAGRTVDNIESLDILLYDGTRMTVGKTSEGELARLIDQGGRIGDIYKRLKILVDAYADEIRRTFPPIPRRVSGYSIDQLLPENGFNVARALVGSECTLVTILEATVQLIPSPPKRVLLVAGFDDIAIAGDHVPMILDHKPIGLEGMDRRLTNAMQKKGLHADKLGLLPGGDGWLLVEFGAETTEEALDAANTTATALKNNNALVDFRIYDQPQDQKLIWAVRDSALGAVSRTPGEKDNWEGWEDSAVPPAKIGAYLRDFRKLLDKHGYSGAVYGHIGDGCMHNRIDWDPKSQEGIDKWLAFIDEAADLVISYGGSLSGEHGDGQARATLLPKMFGPKIMQAFEEFKTIWDPDWKMNPGKVIRPYRIDENLRYGPDYNPPAVKTYFEFPDDEGSFARATERCVGAGVCRKEHDGVMCPSYMATRDEQHVTRGRAHLLFEMLRGDPLTGGWKNEQVREALDLCLACKGCKGECPVRVDMATYKSEFLAHYYEGRMRPRAAYTMGLIYWGSRIASKMPSLVNAITHAPGLSVITKRIAGIHPKRTIPRFAKQTFKEWFFRRPLASFSAFVKSDDPPTPPPAEGREKYQNPAPLPQQGEGLGDHRALQGFPHREDNRTVILWADTFNNHFHPETAIAATKVLEDAGFTVKVYERSMCCGRPLYDWGMLDQAKRHLLDILKIVDKDVSAGIPIVVLEPSCASVFRDELKNLFPHREDAKRLSESTYLLSEFLEKFAPEYQGIGHRVLGLGDKAIVQLHCHHRSIMNKDDENTVLKRCGIDAEVLDAGCCGMAGAFGFEEDHYDISIQIGERKLLPKIRETPRDHVIIADGFSCREQIEQATGRKTYHLAEVLAIKHGQI
jgi:FAD/FMN-containing dehydrogenase/Fe-S oxidoreductase